MAENRLVSRLELIISFTIAIVSITTALVTWRGSAVGSSAGDANHRGLIDALKKEAATSENLRMLYEEATSAQNYAAYAAQLESLVASDDTVVQAQAKQLKQFMLPSLAQMSTLASNPAYLKPDGTLNLEKRLADLEAEYPDLKKLDPESSFKRADLYTAEQRWLTVDIILLIASLFWFTMAQITARRVRLIAFTTGGVVYFLGIVTLAIAEIAYYLMRGSL